MIPNQNYDRKEQEQKACLRLHSNDTKPKLNGCPYGRGLSLRLHSNDTKPKQA